MLQYLLQLIVTKTIPSHRTEEGHALLEVPGRFDWKQRSIPDQPQPIRQAKEKAWPSFRLMPRNLPDEFISVGSKGENQIV